MGYGLPAALGAKAAFPDRKVVAVVGDGGFLMSGMELATAVQERLPVVVLLVNDNSLTLILRHAGAALRRPVHRRRSAQPGLRGAGAGLRHRLRPRGLRRRVRDGPAGGAGRGPADSGGGSAGRRAEMKRRAGA